MVRKAVSIAAIVLAVFTASEGEARLVDLTSGTPGTDSQLSFAGVTRGVHVAVPISGTTTLSSMSVRLLDLDGDATVTASVWDNFANLQASASVSVSAGASQIVVVPITATLISPGPTYYLCFSVDSADPVGGAKSSHVGLLRAPRSGQPEATPQPTA